MKHLSHQSREKDVYEVNYGLMLGLLWVYGGAFRSPWPTLGSLWDHFTDTLGAFRGRCMRMRVALGHFGVTLSSRWVHF